MRKLLMITGLGLMGMLFSSCALYRIVMPYHEHDACRIARGKGYCGSVRDIYLKFNNPKINVKKENER